MKPVKDVMRSLSASCAKTDSLLIVAGQMLSSKIEFLPVVDENQEVIGTLTYKDITLLTEHSNIERLKVSDAMRTEPFSINTYDDEASAFKLMRNNRASYLPVVDDENHLKGVVSFMALARRIILLKQELRGASDKRKVQGLGLSA